MNRCLLVLVLTALLTSCAASSDGLHMGGGLWGSAGGWKRVGQVCKDGSISSRCPLR